jgi:HSP20 family protein
MTGMFNDEAMENGMTFVPEANVLETEKAVEVTLDLPGMKPEDVRLEVREGRLCVSGEKREEKEEKGKTFHRIERRSGAFLRAIPLPAVVDDTKADAKFVEGVLKVTLPKTAEAMPKAIPINAAAKA